MIVDKPMFSLKFWCNVEKNKEPKAKLDDIDMSWLQLLEILVHSFVTFLDNYLIGAQNFS